MTKTTPYFAHPQAIVDSTQIGRGTRIWAFAHVLKGARIGKDCNLCDHAFIEGGATIGDRVTIKNAVLVWEGVTVESDVFLGPGVCFTNDLLPRSPRSVFAGPRHEGKGWLVKTLVRRNASVGANATIICGVTVGRHAMVGAGSVVTKDVPAHALVVGSPARQIGWVSPSGARLTFDASGIAVCPETHTRWRLMPDQSVRALRPARKTESPKQS
jgi:acetyltransferase-like isoleucine patch superfamily enzyme